MTLEQQIARLEAKIEILEATIDGSEWQTREATAYLIGIVTRYLHETGLINEDALSRYVALFNGDPDDRDDYLGDLVRLFGANLDFHKREASAYAMEPERLDPTGQ